MAIMEFEDLVSGIDIFQGIDDTDYFGGRRIKKRRKARKARRKERKAARKVWKKKRVAVKKATRGMGKKAKRKALKSFRKQRRTARRGRIKAGIKARRGLRRKALMSFVPGGKLAMAIKARRKRKAAKKKAAKLKKRNGTVLPVVSEIPSYQVPGMVPDEQRVLAPGEIEPGEIEPGEIEPGEEVEPKKMGMMLPLGAAAAVGLWFLMQGKKKK